jgi:hypothetical protein
MHMILDDNLDTKLYCIEKDLQRWLCNTKKQTSLTFSP